MDVCPKDLLGDEPPWGIERMFKLLKQQVGRIGNQVHDVFFLHEGTPADKSKIATYAHLLQNDSRPPVLY